MNVAMIGGIGHNGYVFDGIRKRDDVHIVAVAPGPHETDILKLEAAARRIDSTVKSYSDYRDLLDREKPDVVSVACHYGDHAAVSLDVIARGHALFIEKPIATELGDLDKIEKAHAASGVELSCMLGTRYAPSMLSAWRAVGHGAVGPVRLMLAQKSYKLGSRAEFYSSRALYGGTIPWVGSHAIDWLHWFSGLPFERVYATHSTTANDDQGELEVSALCHFTMKGDVFASVSMDYLRPAQAASHGDDRIRVVGESGVIEVQAERVTLIDDQGERELGVDAPRSIFGDFIDQIRGEGECLVSAQDAFTTTRACLLARQSADERREIRFP